MSLFGYTLIKTSELENIRRSKRRYNQIIELISWMGEFDIIVEMRKGFMHQISRDVHILDYSSIRESMRKIAKTKDA